MKLYVRLIAFILLALLGTADARADCATGNALTPSVTLVHEPDPGTPDGITTFKAIYNFPGTTNNDQRHLQFGEGSSLVGYSTDGISGTRTIDRGVYCRAPGNYTFTARVWTTCGTTSPIVTSTVTVPIDNTPSVSVTVSDPIAGKATATVEYAFPFSHGSPNRELWMNVNGHVTSTGVNQVSDTWTSTVTTECWPTGTYPVTANARACANPAIASDTTNLTVDNKPSVDISYSELNGGVATIGYAFPNVYYNADRRLQLYVDGVLASSSQPTTWSGNWNVTVGTCWKRLRVVATSCGQSGNPQYTAEDEREQPEKKIEPITVALLKVPGDSIQATIGWSGVTVGGTISVKLQNWINAAGQPIAGGLLKNITATAASGTHTFTFPRPPGARQLSVAVTAPAACGTATGDASIKCDDCEATGNPVFWSDGNMRLSDGEPLPRIAGHGLVRTYDSEEQAGGLFGRGWTTLFERRLIAHADGAVSIMTETNAVVTFRPVLGVFRQTWPRSGDALGTLVYNSGAGTYTYRAPGATETAVFRASDGRLVTLRDGASAREAIIAYDAQGRPSTFSDAVTGVTWNLTVDAQRRITSISVAGYPDLTWTYSYDASGNLLTVLAPGIAAWRTYEYSSNRMTASYDALGNLIESHTYDADGYATASTGDIDEIVNIEYGLPGAIAEERVTRVTYRTGAQAEYTLRAVGGGWRTVETSGGCASCGSHDATYVRDARGRAVREQGADGYITVTTYADGRVVSEERALKPAGCDPQTDAQHCRLGTDALAVAVLEPTNATVKTTYEYEDPLWPDRATAMVRPSVAVPGKLRREDYAHHPVTGAVVSATVCGWLAGGSACSARTTLTSFYEGSGAALAPAFDPGGSFQSAWLALPQPSLLPKSIDGPRTDVEDVSSLVYYPIDASVPAVLRGRLAATKNAAGHVTRYEDYDVFGNVTRIIDPNGVASEMTYDALGRLATSTTKGVPGCNTADDPLCATDLTSTRTYTSVSGPLQLDQRPAGGVTAYAYDERGRVETISRGPAESDLRERIETSYDPLTGKKSLERTLAFEAGAWVEKQRQSFAYDSQARLQTVTHADGAAIHYTYDAKDRVATIRDENHATANTTYAYDPAGRLASVTQTLAGASGGVITTHYANDTDGNLTSVTDPNGNVTSYVYDNFGQLTAQQSPVTGTTTYAYDSAGNLMQLTDANGAATTRVYDAVGRVTTATSTLASATEVVAWSYDDPAAGRFAIGRLASMTDPSGSTVYSYERRGLLRDETRTLVGAQYTYTTGFEYDADGNRTKVNYPSTQLTVAYGFDYAGRPTSASDYVTEAIYLPFGPLTQLTFANDTRQHMNYDTRYRMTGNSLSTILPPPGKPAVLAAYTYAYDATGNITSLLDDRDPSYDRTFQYDDLNRLTAANTGAALWRRGSYTWDALGNMLSLKLGEIEKGDVEPGDLARPPRHQRSQTEENLPLGRSSSFVYDGTTSRLAEVTTNDLSRFVNADAAGNETSYVATRTYSPRNLLAQVIDPGEPGEPLVHTITYTYDGRGIRVARAESPSDGPNTAARRFSIYTPELQLMAVTRDDASNVWTLSAGDRNIDYEIVWFAGRPIAQVTPGGLSRFNFTDHLGTPILQVTGTTTTWRAEYEPFGNVYEMRTGKRTDQPLRLPGQEVAMNWEGQEENYNIFRWYRAGWGRYTQSDPYLEPNAEEPNQYAYAGENPTRFKDRFGLFKIDGSCDCGDYPLGQSIAKAVAKACAYTKKPACADLVKKLSPGGKPLDQCLKQRCSDDTLIVCKKDVTSACGSYSGLSKNIYLFKGHSLCPSAFKEMGYAPTIFHEAIHSCNLMQEPYNNDPLSDAFNEIMKVCTGYKEK